MSQIIKSKQEKKYSLLDWLKMPTEQVLDIFAALPNSQRVGKGDKQFVYIPGTLEKKVLLVAHSDTVWDDPKDKRSIKYSGGQYASNINNIGIGADDRAGIAMLWHLRNLGHSLLIPNAEEDGCVGSRFLMSNKEWSDRINSEHQFAIEFDRMNSSDLCFYHVGSREFSNWCEANFKGYKTAHGTYTDICVLCDTICGVNISVGYYGQHTTNEHLVEAEWYKTLNITKSVLAIKDIPRFEQPDEPIIHPRRIGFHTEYCSSHSNAYAYNGRRREQQSDSEYDSYDDYLENKYGYRRQISTNNKTNNSDYTGVSLARYGISTDQYIVCTNSDCDGVMTMSEYNSNNDRCIFCGTGPLF